MKRTYFFARFALIFVLIYSIIGCRSNNPTLQKEFHSNLSNEIIVIKLKGKVKPDFIVGAFKNYDLKILSPIDINKNIWLVTWDKSLITTEEIVKKLRYSQFSSDAAVLEIPELK